MKGNNWMLGIVQNKAPEKLKLYNLLLKMFRKYVKST